MNEHNNENMAEGQPDRAVHIRAGIEATRRDVIYDAYKEYWASVFPATIILGKDGKEKR